MVESQHCLEMRKTSAACVFVAGPFGQGHAGCESLLGFYEFLSANRSAQCLGVPMDHVSMEVHRGVHHTAAVANAFQRS